MIYINNKHCEESTDAVCCRITWKNNDERRQALMRHLELHIKRQPGVFLHSLGHWCLSLMPCASLKGSRLWFGCQMGRFFFFFLSHFQLCLIFCIFLNVEVFYDFKYRKLIRQHPTRPRCFTVNGKFNLDFMMIFGFEICSLQKLETNSMIGFYTAGCIEYGTANFLKHVIEGGFQFYSPVGYLWQLKPTESNRVRAPQTPVLQSGKYKIPV